MKALLTSGMGMREGGWRRLVVPSQLAYGEAGLPKAGGRAGRSLQVEPGQDVFVDMIMMDGGSGRCDELLRLPYRSSKKGIPAFAHDGKLASISCVAGKT